MDPHDENLQYIQHLEVTWKPLLKAIKIVINRDIDETHTQQILNIMQSWINLTGTLQITKARDSYLRLLCNSCSPKENEVELSAKHIQISKALFNIAHCLGSNFLKNRKSEKNWIFVKIEKKWIFAKTEKMRIFAKNQKNAIFTKNRKNTVFSDILLFF